MALQTPLSEELQTIFDNLVCMECLEDLFVRIDGYDTLVECCNCGHPFNLKDALPNDNEAEEENDYDEFGNENQTF